MLEPPCNCFGCAVSQAFVIAPLVAVEIIKKQEYIGSFDGVGCGVFCTVVALRYEGWGKWRKTWVRVVGMQAEIRNLALSNVKQMQPATQQCDVCVA
jgi:hypothetical protein